MHPSNCFFFFFRGKFSLFTFLPSMLQICSWASRRTAFFFIFANPIGRYEFDTGHAFRENRRTFIDKIGRTADFALEVRRAAIRLYIIIFL